MYIMLISMCSPEVYLSQVQINFWYMNDAYFLVKQSLHHSDLIFLFMDDAIVVWTNFYEIIQC
jgi:hypothetical protein